MGAWQNGVRFCDLGICVRIEKDGCDDVVKWGPERRLLVFQQHFGGTTNYVGKITKGIEGWLAYLLK